MAIEILYGTECKHWKDCEFRNDIDCDSEMCEEFENETYNILQLRKATCQMQDGQ